MASSGTSSGSSSLNQTSCSDEDLNALLDQRKRKRMISNRESARRSRMKKQKQLDDLILQSFQLRSENQQIGSSIALTMENYLRIETENLVLKAQVDELRCRLESLNEIISFLSPMGGVDHGVFGITQFGFGAMLDHHQPIMASMLPNMYQC